MLINLTGILGIPGLLLPSNNAFFKPKFKYGNPLIVIEDESVIKGVYSITIEFGLEEIILISCEAITGRHKNRKIIILENLLFIKSPPKNSIKTYIINGLIQCKKQYKILYIKTSSFVWSKNS